MLEACNDKIATEPFKGGSVDKRTGNGVTLPGNKLTLYKFKVLFGSPKYPTGSFIYVPDEVRVHAWAKSIHELNNGTELVKFILVPESFIVLKENNND
jgi:hypothetical protein